MPQSVILLTACVNPKGMLFTQLQNPQIRLQQYKETLKWYLENISEKIVLVENTLCDFSNDFSDFIAAGRLECLTFDGNSYDRKLGKGYGEALIIKTALEQSKILRKCDIIIKITGRLKVKNINRLIHDIKNHNTIYANTDLRNGHVFCYSALFISPKEFLNNYFLPKINRLDDSEGYFFEHLLYDSMIQWKKEGGKHTEFKQPLIIDGVSGTSGERYMNSTHFIYLKSFLKYIAHINRIYRNHFDF